ncbi:protein STRUBBELIG-RECEPTOR FAMILY 3-like [Wolffia australiana]
MLFRLVLALVATLLIPLSSAYTYEEDVFAINGLYVSLGSPPIPGWTPNGGDPCTESWQGVQCVGPNITGIILNGANLGGVLGDTLVNFSSIITIDLSNNHIGGSIPEGLPSTMQRFFLSDNAFTGSIPDSLSTLGSLTDMSLSHNMLSGALPDSFQALTGLINLDLSFNSLSGTLPPSMASLSSLTTLRIQNNQFSGVLDVLQGLPLMDLNIENNLFSGTVPAKLYTIPNFRSDGNPFNTTAPPSSSPLSPPATPSKPGSRPSAQDSPSEDNGEKNNSEGKKKLSNQRIIGLAFAGAITIIILILVVLLVLNYCLSKQRRRKQTHENVVKIEELAERPRQRESPVRPPFAVSSGKVAVALPVEPDVKREEERRGAKTVAAAVGSPPAELPAVVTPPAELAAVAAMVEKPRIVQEKKKSFPENFDLAPIPVVNLSPPTSVASFSVGSLQQYTNSFTEERIIRDSRLGRVYHAKLPDGKELAIMKLDNVNNSLPVEAFFEMVLMISELRHENILELVGYCAEHGQRLLVYNFFSRRSLYDILHGDDELKRKLSWKARIQIALGAARALEYLHDARELPVVHRDVESSNILLDSELSVRVCDCGLASILSTSSVTQLSGKIRSFSYEAPEVNDSGSYSEHSDIYSFGVVMLELLTARKPYDSSRPRGEQYLVRWTSPQFHDIDMLTKMVDPSLKGNYPVKSLSRFADIISRCVQNSPEFRPPVSEVVQDLVRMVEELKGESSRQV